MALVTVHSTPLVRQFQSTWISRASFFTLFCFILCLICPLLVAFQSQGFWVKYQIHRERPTISFKYQALLLAKGTEGSEITWSTFAEYNALTSHYFSYPTISVLENDKGLEIDLQLDTRNETIHFIQFLLTFSYQLKEVAQVNMEALGVLQYDSGMVLAGLNYVGDLQWIQKRILGYRQTDNRYNQTILNQFEMADVFKVYNARDYSTQLLNGYYTPVFSGSETSGSLRIKASVRYVEAAVQFAPGFWNTCKWAWVQYLSVLVVFLYIVGWIRDLVFTRQMIPTWNEKQIKTIRQ